MAIKELWKNSRKFKEHKKYLVSNQGNWGNCDENCPKGCHVKVQNKNQILPCVFPYTIPDGVNGDQKIHECTSQYPDEPNEPPLICYTKKNSTTNEVHIGYGDWGVCQDPYCPKPKG